MRVVLVGCGKDKAPEPRPARDLYVGQLFRKARAVAERCDAWFVLSAMHGLVEPDRVVAPYDLRLSDLDRPARARAGERPSRPP